MLVNVNKDDADDCTNLAHYEPALKIIRDHGFKPIGVCQILFENTFIFETDKEASLAHLALECTDHSLVIGWWYGKDDVEKALIKYNERNEKYGDAPVVIHWL